MGEKTFFLTKAGVLNILNMKNVLNKSFKLIITSFALHDSMSLCITHNLVSRLFTLTLSSHILINPNLICLLKLQPWQT